MIAILALRLDASRLESDAQAAGLGGDHDLRPRPRTACCCAGIYMGWIDGRDLAHMYPADQSDWTDFAQVLAAQGYQALTFDFRGFTESEGTWAPNSPAPIYSRRTSSCAAGLANLHRRRETRCRGRNPGRRARGRRGKYLHFGTNQLWRPRRHRFNPSMFARRYCSSLLPPIRWSEASRRSCIAWRWRRSRWRFTRPRAWHARSCSAHGPELQA